MCFFPFGCIWDHYATAQIWCKTRQTSAINAKLRATKSCRNFSQWTLLIHTIGPKTHVFGAFVFRLGAFRTVSLLHYTCCKTRQTGAINAKVCAMMSCKNFWNECYRSTPLDPKLMFWCVSFRSGAFWTVSLLHETWCKSSKLVQLMQKFMPRCRARTFRNECSRSTPLDPKLMFCFVSFRLGAFRTVSLLHKTCCKTRQTGTNNAKVRATMSC